MARVCDGASVGAARAQRSAGTGGAGVEQLEEHRRRGQRLEERPGWRGVGVGRQPVGCREAGGGWVAQGRPARRAVGDGGGRRHGDSGGAVEEAGATVSGNDARRGCRPEESHCIRCQEGTQVHLSLSLSVFFVMCMYMPRFPSIS
jgi:hypothetical protein